MPTAVLPQIPIAVVSTVITLCGAIVLALLDLWLRRKGVKDPTLIWFIISLLSWSLSGAVQLFPAAWLKIWGGVNQIPYFLSPVSSVLFTVAAFRLSRVREIFRREDVRMWPQWIILAVVGLSVTSLMLLLCHQPLLGETVDATASCIALTVLAGGLLYSFYKYGNQLLVGLTGVTFTFLIARQFVGAAHGPLVGVAAAMAVAGTTTLVMLFIALTVAWGLSETSRLRIVGTPAHVTVVALFIDLLGSTEWAHSVINGDFHYAGVFIDQLRTWIWRKALDSGLVRPSIVKFLGDGFMFVWETPQEITAVNAYTKAAVELACALHKEFPLWANNNSALWNKVPEAIGIGVDVGSAIRLTFENGSEDYLGAPINTAAKLQDMARPVGGVVIRTEVWNRLDSDEILQHKFAQPGIVRIGTDKMLSVRATEEVEFREPERENAYNRTRDGHAARAI
ncbi:MAG: hypothetical protein JWN14_2106 [Chthonomonadales bacterium]|nr:hypothetical protein [Chthonomonadales bacterium]